MSGTNISYSEVSGITEQGFWLLVEEREYFVPFEHYPAFRQATVAQIYAFQRSGPGQFYWPSLDVDLELDALADPQHFPLTFRA